MACNKVTKPRGVCSTCGTKRYGSLCRMHRTDGTRKPYSKSHKRCNNRRIKRNRERQDRGYKHPFIIIDEVTPLSKEVFETLSSKIKK